MNGLREKFRNKKGFTLIEMLIVVAIIAILIAISIPLVGSALDNARKATDAANERAFKSALVSSYLLKEAGMSKGDPVNADTPYPYDAVNGKVLTNQTAPTKGYGQQVEKGGVLWGKISADGEVSLSWEKTSVGKDAAKCDNSNCVSADMAAGT